MLRLYFENLIPHFIPHFVPHFNKNITKVMEIVIKEDGVKIVLQTLIL